MIGGGKMKKILFATTNPAKVNRFSKKLLEQGIELISLLDINQKINIEENGKNAIENALIKAKCCYQAVGIPTMATDDTLFLEGVPVNKQPGVYVRRINGKRLSDEEEIEYYSNLVKEYGKEGKLIAKYVYGLALVTKDKEQTYTWDSEDFYIIDKPSEKLQPGYPLNSISIDIKSGKYFTDITSEEKDGTHDDRGVIDFIVKNS